jgi:hypothetical protein
MNNSCQKSRLLDSKKFEYFLSEAGIPYLPSSFYQVNLTKVVDDALKLTGLTEQDIENIHDAFLKKQISSNIPKDIWIGLAALGILESTEIVDFFIKAGGKLGDIIAKNIDTLFTEETFHKLQDAILELGLNLPSGTVHFAETLINFIKNPDGITKILCTLENSADFVEVLEVVGTGVEIGANLADLIDATTTLGLSLAVSYGVKKLVDVHYKPILEEQFHEIRIQKDKYIELFKLRQAIKEGLPGRVVSVQLRNVEKYHWGF